MRSDLLRLLVGSEFPFPIAYSFRRAVEERDKDSRGAACGVLQSTLECLGLILMADYLSGEERDPDIDLELSKVRDSPPSVGVWREWISCVLRRFGATSRPLFLKGISALAERDSQKELARLIESRNRWIHADSHFDLGPFRRGLCSLFAKLSFLHKAFLVCPHSARLIGQLHFLEVSLLKGDNPAFGQVECRSDIALETGHVYFYSSEARELLPLHPLVLYGKCAHCEDQHYFHYNRTSGRKLVYASMPKGHEHQSSEAFLLLEEMVRNPKPRRLRPRHFSIPGDFASLSRTLRPGDHIGPYEVEQLIKIGGMAQIYRVIDTRTAKCFALKLLPIELARDPVLLMRFEEEAQNLGG